jgi:hypothetical protein
MMSGTASIIGCFNFRSCEYHSQEILTDQIIHILDFIVLGERRIGITAKLMPSFAKLVGILGILLSFMNGTM